MPYTGRMLLRLPLSVSLIVSVGVQVICQLFKVVYYSLRTRRLALSWLISAGGMPSAHSAFVSSLAVSIGLWAGFSTDLFAVTCVFSIIIIYDSLRLRGAVQHHARILSQLVQVHPEINAGPINLRLGHRVSETLAGILVGGGCALLAWVLLR
jgi:uncharacterized protein